MRVDRLRLIDYKNLKDFRVDFDVTSSRQVVVGRNGVGKSNLLEALAWSFRELDLEEDASFAYEVEYHCNGHYVRIDATRPLTGAQSNSQKFGRTYELAPAPKDPSEDNGSRSYKPIRQSEFYRRNRVVDGAVNASAQDLIEQVNVDLPKQCLEVGHVCVAPFAMSG